MRIDPSRRRRGIGPDEASLTRGDGPSLEQYVETRLNLLTETLKGIAETQKETLSVALTTLKDAAAAAAMATDLRYQQRFDAQSDALSAAFSSQQTAMQTAFTVAEKAVQAALAAADRAVSKAELAADKRFESVNEFRKTLDDQQRTLMPRQESDRAFQGLTDKFVSLKEQLDALVAERVGIKGGWGYAVGLVGAIVGLLALVRYFTP
jgi:hypothetical protein